MPYYNIVLLKYAKIDSFFWGQAIQTSKLNSTFKEAQVELRKFLLKFGIL